jgi:fibronectin-binding autotransporter adhesin
MAGFTGRLRFTSGGGSGGDVRNFGAWEEAGGGGGDANADGGGDPLGLFVKGGAKVGFRGGGVGSKGGADVGGGERVGLNAVAGGGGDMGGEVSINGGGGG